MIARGARSRCVVVLAALLAGVRVEPPQPPRRRRRRGFRTIRRRTCPRRLRVTAAVATRHELGVAAAAGRRSARREPRLHRVLKRAPGVLSGRDRPRVRRTWPTVSSSRRPRGSRAALARNDEYLPALDRAGRSAARPRTTTTQAIAAMERVLALDPKRDAVRSAARALRFRQLQSLIDAGRRARQAGRLDEAADGARAGAGAVAGERDRFCASSRSIELARGAARSKPRRTRGRRCSSTPSDAEGHAALGDVLEARGRLPRRRGRATRGGDRSTRGRNGATSATTLREKADLAALPAEFRRPADRRRRSRAAQLAGLIGIRLEDADRAARRSASPPWPPTSATTGRRPGFCR